MGPVQVLLPRPHQHQQAFISSPAKRKIIRAGRRGGKTIGVSIFAVQKFLEGHRVLYATPTADQLESFWSSVSAALYDAVEQKVFRKNETEHSIERMRSKQRLRGKTAWNANSLRGDYADVLILDEFQLMNEDTWSVVGAPMLLDNDGDAIFIYTPPSLSSRAGSKAKDPQHAAKLFRKHQNDASGRWETFHFRSMDNPFLSVEALEEIATDMTALAYRMEIQAEDVDEAPGALWRRLNLEEHRWATMPEMSRIVVAVDPTVSGKGTGDEAGIIIAGRAADAFFPLEDRSTSGSPLKWARAAINAFHAWKADTIVAEANQGGEMVAITIHQVDPDVPVKLVNASRGKQVRAEPISAIYENGRAHHIGSFPALEDELCLWIPGDPSPNRLDALVWAGTELMLKSSKASMDSYV